MTQTQCKTESSDRRPADPFDFLNKSLNLLIVEDDDLSFSFAEDLFAPIRVYSVLRGRTTSEALSLLRSGARYHVCILDLGMKDVENDEFYVLRQYAHHCSMVVLTGSRSAEKGAASIQLGARAVFEKGPGFSGRDFTKAVNRLALLNIVNHRYSENAGDTLSFATQVLFDRNPSSVTEWAEYLRISDRQLRNLWAQGSGFGAKYVLYSYNLYRMAFEYHENCNFGTPDVKKRPLTSPAGYRKLLAYFETHKEIVSFLVS